MTPDEVLPARDRSQGDPHSYSSLDGRVFTHIDIENFDFYIEVRDGARPRDICDAITQAEWWGLELLDPEEDDDVIQVTDEGDVRHYLCPTVPVNNTVTYMRDLRDKITLPGTRTPIYQRVLTGVLGVGVLLSTSDIVQSYGAAVGIQ